MSEAERLRSLGFVPDTDRRIADALDDLVEVFAEIRDTLKDLAQFAREANERDK